MDQKTGSYQIIDFPAERRAMPAYLELKSGRHVMYALLDVDVTVARKFIEDYKAQTGEQLSFTGYLAFCLAHAVDENKTVQAYKKGNNKLIVFNDVDVGIMIERKQGETPVLTGHVIRSANHKTYREIHQEIRSVQSEPVPPNNGMPTWFRSALLLPWPLSSVVQGFIPHDHASQPDDRYIDGRHSWYFLGRYVWQGSRWLGDC